MFGLSFGEMIVVVIALVVFIGPKDLPRVARKLGRWAAIARATVADLREQSGIDEVMREVHSGLEEVEASTERDDRATVPATASIASATATASANVNELAMASDATPSRRSELPLPPTPSAHVALAPGQPLARAETMAGAE